MSSAIVIKKFYRDMPREEVDYLNEVLDEMRDAEVDIPPHVIQRMISRGIIDDGLSKIAYDYKSFSALPGIRDAILTFDEGKLYEISNEGFGRTSNPFRLVLAREFEDGFTMFVKVAPQKGELESVKLLDVWRRKGKLPLYPPPHALKQFVSDWDVDESLEDYFSYDGHQDGHKDGEVSFIDEREGKSPFDDGSSHDQLISA